MLAVILAGRGHASRLEPAREVPKLDGDFSAPLVKELLPAATSEFPPPAGQPPFFHSGMQQVRAGFPPATAGMASSSAPGYARRLVAVH